MIYYQEREYARVTEIISNYINCYGHIDKTMLANKARIGKNVHKAIDQYLKGDIPTLKGTERDYFNSFMQWHQAIRPQILCKEKRLYCDELRITGQIDALAVFPEEKLPVLIDYKCTVKEMPSWRYQAHFYHLLLQKNKYRTSDRIVFLKLNNFNKPPIAYNYAINPNVLEQCVQMAKNFWTKKEK